MGRWLNVLLRWFRRRTTEEDDPLADPPVEPLFGAAGRT
jgi:hypothetical protein